MKTYTFINKKTKESVETSSDIPDDLLCMLGMNYYVPEVLINRYAEITEYSPYYLEDQKVTDDFILKNRDKIDCGIFWRHQFLEVNLRKFGGTVIPWDYISEYQKLSEKVISDFADKLDWTKLSYHQKLSEALIEKFKDRVVWDAIAYTQILSDKFIEKYADKLDWFGISSNASINNQNDEFIIKYKDKIDFYTMIYANAQAADRIVDIFINDPDTLKHIFKDMVYRAPRRSY